MRTILLGLLTTAAMAAEFHLAPGNAAAPGNGSATTPFTTWEAARDALRPVIAARKEPVTVWVHGGTWTRRTGFRLEAADGGTAEAPVTWRAWKAERPELLAAIPVPATALLPVSDPEVLAQLDPAVRDQVRRLDLAALGVTHGGPAPALFADGGGLCRLFAGGRPLPMARWPAETYAAMGPVVDGGGGSGADARGGVFTYRGDRPTRWLPDIGDDLYVAGFWRVPWVLQAVRVARIDPETRTIAHAVPVGGGIGSKYSKEVNGSRVGSGTEPWFVLNALAEIRRPGDWVLRSKTKSIYLLPPTDGALAIIDNADPVIEVQEASHLTLRGLAVIGGLGAGIRIAGGEAVAVLGCRIGDSGRDGVVVQGGRGHRILGNDITASGSRALVVGGGDRKTLTPSGHEVANNHLRDFGRVQWVVPGMDVTGVAVHVHHNLIHDGPNAGILFGGNDHVIEANEIHNIGLNSGDLGAIYASVDWASRGTVIRGNLIHHVGNAQGVYLDDGKSGDTVTGNLIIGALNGVFLSGGHDLTVTGNWLVACTKAGVHVDDRGVARKYNADSKGHVRWLHEYRYQQPPWSEHYPDLVGILDHHPEWPTNIRIDGNLIVGAKDLDLPKNAEHRQFILVGSNQHLADPALFANVPALDFTVAANAPALGAPPARDAGLLRDELRPTLPTAEETGRFIARPSRIVFDSSVDQDASDRAGK